MHYPARLRPGGRCHRATGLRGSRAAGPSPAHPRSRAGYTGPPPRQQELPQDEELLPHEDELLPQDDELLPQDDELLPQEALVEDPSHDVPMTYQDASLSELPAALVADPALPVLPALPVGRDLPPRPTLTPAAAAWVAKSSHARRQARRSSHVPTAIRPTTAAPTRTSAVTMTFPP
ncbi:hypothetical protein [Streptomyces sp. NPDC006527]|uniref:hypothetical protein n=1 Tax=Streptomyces sp. NPDC006527 TaxID=3364749 RepID=UPI003696C6A1